MQAGCAWRNTLRRVCAIGASEQQLLCHSLMLARNNGILAFLNDRVEGTRNLLVKLWAAGSVERDQNICTVGIARRRGTRATIFSWFVAARGCNIVRKACQVITWTLCQRLLRAPPSPQRLAAARNRHQRLLVLAAGGKFPRVISRRRRP